MYKKKLFFIALVLFLLLFCFVYFVIKNKNKILLETVTWKYVGNNQSVILDRDGRLMLGPANLTIWGKYPYIVGDCFSADRKSKYFIIDMVTNNIYLYNNFQQLKKLHAIEFNLNEFVTFQDLRGQWAKSEKLKKLLANLHTSMAPSSK